MAEGDEDESSKTEAPSERKIEKAKEEGDVAVSQEVKSFIMLLGMLFVVWLVLPLMAKWYYNLTIKFIADPAGIPIDPGHINFLMKDVFIGILKIMSIPFLLFMVLGVFSNVSQTGFIYAPKKLSPKWDKLNVFAQFKNFINMKKIVESLKGIIKIIIVGTLTYYVIKPYIIKADLMTTMESYAILKMIHKIVILLIFTVTAAVLVIALADYAYQRYAFMKKLRMTKQEVKDEYKQTEGDPMVKSRIRQVRMERARYRMMEQVPKADVVITNPTHFAVALKYDMDNMDAPMVVAKGMDNIAFKIREVAAENDVPIIENPPLARALYASVELEQSIPEEHFKAVAEVIGYVMSIKN